MAQILIFVPRKFARTHMRNRVTGNMWILIKYIIFECFIWIPATSEAQKARC